MYVQSAYSKARTENRDRYFSPTISFLSSLSLGSMRLRLVVRSPQCVGPPACLLPPPAVLEEVKRAVTFSLSHNGSLSLDVFGTRTTKISSVCTYITSVCMAPSEELSSYQEKHLSARVFSGVHLYLNTHIRRCV